MASQETRPPERRELAGEFQTRHIPDRTVRLAVAGPNANPSAIRDRNKAIATI